MTLDTTLSPTIRTHILSFIISAFQSLDSGIVRKECAPLVSISIWHNLSSDKKRNAKLDQGGQLRKAWRAAAKRYDAADEPTQVRLRFERSWLYTLMLDFMNQLYDPTSKAGKREYPLINITVADEYRKPTLLRTFYRIPFRFGEPVANQTICQYTFARSAYHSSGSTIHNVQ